jgi:hypothetical protein
LKQRELGIKHEGDDDGSNKIDTEGNNPAGALFIFVGYDYRMLQ